MSTERSKAGFGLLKITIICVLLVGAAAVILPNIAKARVTRAKNACAMNSMWIEAAKQVWAVELGKGGNETPSEMELRDYMERIEPRWGGQKIQMMSPFDASGKLVSFCPFEGRITIGSVTQRVACSSTQWEESHFEECYGSLIRSTRPTKAIVP